MVGFTYRMLPVLCWALLVVAQARRLEERSPGWGGSLVRPTIPSRPPIDERSADWDGGLIRPTIPLQPLIDDNRIDEESHDPTIILNNGFREITEGLYEGDIVLTQEQKRFLQERKATSPVKYWPKDSNDTVTVGYRFGDTIINQALVQVALAHWETNTCIRFKEVNSTVGYAHLNFTNAGYCSSYVGRVASMTTGQSVWLYPTCLTEVGPAVHEIGHALGFNHEQARSDRDDYVQVMWSNIEVGKESNFDKRATYNYGISYDYWSVMHYGPYYFTSNGQSTLLAFNPIAQPLMGNRIGLSFADKRMANTMYGCIDKWLTNCSLSSDPCQNMGYTGPACSCVCPEGTSGPHCEVLLNSYTDALIQLKTPYSETITTPGTVSTPGYPTPIQTRTKFVKVLVAPYCYKVKLTVHDFDVYGRYTDGTCAIDGLNVRTQDALGTGVTYCGKEIANGTVFISENNTIVLDYYNYDYTTVTGGSRYRGFNATVEHIPDDGCNATTPAAATPTATTSITTTLTTTTPNTTTETTTMETTTTPNTTTPSDTTLTDTNTTSTTPTTTTPTTTTETTTIETTTTPTTTTPTTTTPTTTTTTTETTTTPTTTTPTTTTPTTTTETTTTETTTLETTTTETTTTPTTTTPTTTTPTTTTPTTTTPTTTTPTTTTPTTTTPTTTTPTTTTPTTTTPTTIKPTTTKPTTTKPTTTKPTTTKPTTTKPTTTKPTTTKPTTTKPTTTKPTTTKPTTTKPTTTKPTTTKPTTTKPTTTKPTTTKPTTTKPTTTKPTTTKPTTTKPTTTKPTTTKPTTTKPTTTTPTTTKPTTTRRISVNTINSGDIPLTVSASSSALCTLSPTSTSGSYKLTGDSCSIRLRTTEPRYLKVTATSVLTTTTGEIVKLNSVFGQASSITTKGTGISYVLPSSSTSLVIPSIAKSLGKTFELGLQVQNSDCHQIIKVDAGATGTLAKINYPADTVCEWWIQAPSGRKIQLAFSAFNVGTSGCAADFLGIDTSGDQLYKSASEKYCATTSPKTLTSSGEQMNVLLKGIQGGFPGFIATYSVV